MPRYAITTFGCQMNVHDSERMSEVLRRAGYDVVAEPEQADVVLLNTCSVREKAEQKLRSEVGRLAKLKRSRRDLVLVVAGCVAQQEGERLLERMSAIDLVNSHPQGLTEKEIREGLEGNLCRCTGYHNIVKAIAAAADVMHGKRETIAAAAE